MRRPLASLALLGALLSVTPGTGAQAGASYDWWLLTVTAGDAGATNAVVTLSADGATTGDAAHVFGVGISHEGGLDQMHVYNLGLGPRAVSTSGGGGKVHVDLAPNASGLAGGFTSIVGFGALAPHETFSVLVFQTGAVAGEPTVQTQVSTGAVGTDVTYGSGSRYVAAGDPGDGGVSANLDGIGAGDVVARRTVGTGIAGGVVTHCNACTGTWRAPDGRTGRFGVAGHESFGVKQLGAGPYATPEEVVGAAAFAGPGGDWRYEWTGLDVVRGNSPAEIAYAPIGDAWPLFARGLADLPSSACAGGSVLVDQASDAVHVRVMTLRPTMAERQVCVRVEDPYSHVGVGGRMVVHTDGTFGAPDLAKVGKSSAACAATTPPNSFPTPNPLVAENVLGVRTTVEAYRGGDRVALCFAVDGVADGSVTVNLDGGASVASFDRDPVVL